MIETRRPFSTVIPVRPDPEPTTRLSPMARRVAANKQADRRLVWETARLEETDR